MVYIGGGSYYGSNYTSRTSYTSSSASNSTRRYSAEQSIHTASSSNGAAVAGLGSISYLRATRALRSYRSPPSSTGVGGASVAPPSAYQYRRSSNTERRIGGATAATTKLEPATGSSGSTLATSWNSVRWAKPTSAYRSKYQRNNLIESPTKLGQFATGGKTPSYSNNDTYRSTVSTGTSTNNRTTLKYIAEKPFISNRPKRSHSGGMDDKVRGLADTLKSTTRENNAALPRKTSDSALSVVQRLERSAAYRRSGRIDSSTHASAVRRSSVGGGGATTSGDELISAVSALRSLTQRSAFFNGNRRSSREESSTTTATSLSQLTSRSNSLSTNTSQSNAVCQQIKSEEPNTSENEMTKRIINDPVSQTLETKESPAYFEEESGAKESDGYDSNDEDSDSQQLPENRRSVSQTAAKSAAKKHKGCRKRTPVRTPLSDSLAERVKGVSVEKPERLQPNIPSDEGDKKVDGKEKSKRTRPNRNQQKDDGETNVSNQLQQTDAECQLDEFSVEATLFLPKKKDVSAEQSISLTLSLKEPSPIANDAKLDNGTPLPEKHRQTALKQAEELSGVINELAAFVGLAADTESARTTDKSLRTKSSPVSFQEAFTENRKPQVEPPDKDPTTTAKPPISVKLTEKWSSVNLPWTKEEENKTLSVVQTPDVQMISRKKTAKDTKNIPTTATNQPMLPMTLSNESKLMTSKSKTLPRSSTKKATIVDDRSQSTETVTDSSLADGDMLTNRQLRTAKSTSILQENPQLKKLVVNKKASTNDLSKAITQSTDSQKDTDTQHHPTASQKQTSNEKSSENIALKPLSNALLPTTMQQPKRTETDPQKDTLNKQPKLLPDAIPKGCHTREELKEKGSLTPSPSSLKTTSDTKGRKEKEKAVAELLAEICCQLESEFAAANVSWTPSCRQAVSHTVNTRRRRHSVKQSPLCIRKLSHMESMRVNEKERQILQTFVRLTPELVARRERFGFATLSTSIIDTAAVQTKLTAVPSLTFPHDFNTGLTLALVGQERGKLSLEEDGAMAREGAAKQQQRLREENAASLSPPYFEAASSLSPIAVPPSPTDTGIVVAANKAAATADATTTATAALSRPPANTCSGGTAAGFPPSTAVTAPVRLVPSPVASSCSLSSSGARVVVRLSDCPAGSTTSTTPLTAIDNSQAAPAVPNPLQSAPALNDATSILEQHEQYWSARSATSNSPVESLNNLDRNKRKKQNVPTRRNKKSLSPFIRDFSAVDQDMLALLSLGQQLSSPTNNDRRDTRRLYQIPEFVENAKPEPSLPQPLDHHPHQHQMETAILLKPLAPENRNRSFEILPPVTSKRQQRRLAENPFVLRDSYDSLPGLNITKANVDFVPDKTSYNNNRTKWMTGSLPQLQPLTAKQEVQNQQSSLEEASMKIDQLLTSYRTRHNQEQTRFHSAVAHLDEIYEQIRREFDRDTAHVSRPSARQTKVVSQVAPIEDVWQLNRQPKQQYHAHNRRPQQTVNESVKHRVETRHSKQDYTQRWLADDLRSWSAANPKPDLLDFDPLPAQEFAASPDDDVQSIGSCSAEIVEICGTQSPQGTPSPPAHVPDLVPMKKRRTIIKPAPIRYQTQQQQYIEQTTRQRRLPTKPAVMSIPDINSTSLDSARKTIEQYIQQSTRDAAAKGVGATVETSFYSEPSPSVDVGQLMAPVFSKPRTETFDTCSIASERSSAAHGFIYKTPARTRNTATYVAPSLNSQQVAYDSFLNERTASQPPQRTSGSRHGTLEKPQRNLSSPGRQSSSSEHRINSAQFLSDKLFEKLSTTNSWHHDNQVPMFHDDVENLVAELELNTDSFEVKLGSFPTNAVVDRPSKMAISPLSLDAQLTRNSAPRQQNLHRGSIDRRRNVVGDEENQSTVRQMALEFESNGRLTAPTYPKTRHFADDQMIAADLDIAGLTWCERPNNRDSVISVPTVPPKLPIKSYSSATDVQQYQNGCENEDDECIYDNLPIIPNVAQSHQNLTTDGADLSADILLGPERNGGRLPMMRRLMNRFHRAVGASATVLSDRPADSHDGSGNGGRRRMAPSVSSASIATPSTDISPWLYARNDDATSPTVKAVMVDLDNIRDAIGPQKSTSGFGNKLKRSLSKKWFS